MEISPSKNPIVSEKVQNVQLLLFALFVFAKRQAGPVSTIFHIVDYFHAKINQYQIYTQYKFLFFLYGNVAKHIHRTSITTFSLMMLVTEDSPWGSILKL
jgi:hypothetical protein